MNVAAHALLLTTQRRPAELRREPPIATRPAAAFRQLRDAQGIAPGRRVAAEPERREANAERRTPRQTPSETPRPRQRRDGEERGRLLDFYC